MPFTKIKTNGGSFKFHYTISTPTNASAKSIQKDLPTIIFLHPVYIGQALFHPQFMDPKLRRFNIVGIDCRGHGETVGGIQRTYGPHDTADDVFKIMEDLKLPACHFVALSMGCSTAIELAIARPNKVLSLFLMSPLPFREPDEVAEGRMEIHLYWREGFANPKKPDHEALATAVHGALQLAFNNVESAQSASIVKYSVPQVTRHFGPGLTDGHRMATCEFFLADRSCTPDTLGKIACPVMLIHPQGDIAYQYADTELIYTAMKDAGVNIDIKLIDDPQAPHYVSFTHAHLVNPILHDFILSNLQGGAPPIPTAVISPFETILKKNGWEDDDSEAEFI